MASLILHSDLLQIVDGFQHIALVIFFFLKTSTLRNVKKPFAATAHTLEKTLEKIDRISFESFTTNFFKILFKKAMYSGLCTVTSSVLFSPDSGVFKKEMKINSHSIQINYTQSLRNLKAFPNAMLTICRRCLQEMSQNLC